jgi:hypothetical protein
MAEWSCALAMDEHRNLVGGSHEALAMAVRSAADVRYYTAFDYADHMCVPGSEVGLVQGVLNFPVTYWLEGGRVAGIHTMRYPSDCSLGFQPFRPSLSLVVCNDNGQYGVARPYLDGRPGKAVVEDRSGSGYEILDRFDEETPAPSENAMYAYGQYNWWVRNDWEEVLRHDADGAVVSGSLEAVQDAFRSGKEIKVGVQRLCDTLAPQGETPIDHEVFVGMGPIYNHQDQGFLGGESQPIVRVVPGVPLRYRSGNWNYGWILPRTDGVVHHLVVNPYTNEFIRMECRSPVRWFVR